jgi:hypothetical protein
VLAGVKALRSASTRRAAGFGLDAGSAQTTSGNYRRLSRTSHAHSLSSSSRGLKEITDRYAKLVTLAINM